MVLCLASTQKALGLIPSTCKGVVVPGHNPSTGEVEAGVLVSQGLPPLYLQFEASVGCMRSYLTTAAAVSAAAGAAAAPPAAIAAQVDCHT